MTIIADTLKTFMIYTLLHQLDKGNRPLFLMTTYIQHFFTWVIFFKFINGFSLSPKMSFFVFEIFFLGGVGELIVM